MVAFGVGEIVGALGMGALVDRYGARKCVYFILVMIVLMVATTINSLETGYYSWNTFLNTFTWGVQDSFVNIHVFKMLGSEFGSNHSEPFGVEQLLQGISVFVQQIIQAQLDFSNKRTI